MAKVLIVEDDRDSGDAIARALERAGHRTAVAANGEAALSAVVNSSPDLIVLDIRMPVMDGVTFLRILRSYLRWGDVPVVVVTALPDGPDIDRIGQFGVTRVFRKSQFDLAELVKDVGELTGRG